MKEDFYLRLFAVVSMTFVLFCWAAFETPLGSLLGEKFKERLFHLMGWFLFALILVCVLVPLVALVYPLFVGW